MSATDPMPAYPLAVRRSVRYPLISHTLEDTSIDIRKLNGAVDELKNLRIESATILFHKPIFKPSCPVVTAGENQKDSKRA